MTPSTLIRTALAPVLAAALAVPWPGALAHGDEPHGDAPHPVATAAQTPRFESATDLFEAVGRLQDGALVLYLSRFETNEPVLQATVEVESGAHKAAAEFQADRGAYRVTAPELIRALEQPGEHALVITVTAGAEADLLEGPLVVAAPPSAPAGWSASAWGKPAAGVAGLVALGGLVGVLLARRRRVATGSLA